MSRVLRTKRPLGRVRRSPRPSLSEGRVASVTLRIEAPIAEGCVPDEELASWVGEAIARYHLWRSGWVGVMMRGRLRTPVVEVVCPEE